MKEAYPQEARKSGLRIVVEAKNDQLKQRDLLCELDAAMENRGLAFCDRHLKKPQHLTPRFQCRALLTTISTTANEADALVESVRAEVRDGA